LINRAREYDDQVITYQGEVVGDVMRRGDFAWVNLHDGKNAIGVWVPLHLIDQIVYTGSYKSRGDTLLVKGIFQRACPQHGGDLDIHAQQILKVASGRLTPERPNPYKLNQAGILLGVLLAVWILRRLIPS
jgi:hypothetical protein